jgi:hypothetical protein
MRRVGLASAFFLLTLLTPALAARAAVTTYTPPSEPGTIYTVIDFRRAQGEAQLTTVVVNWAGTQRTVTVAAPYAANACSHTTPSGFILKIRHPNADSPLLRLRTDGTVVHPPMQGPLPAEVLHACYKIKT